MNDSEDQEDKECEGDLNKEDSLIVVDVVERIHRGIDGIERHV